jgi:multidrug efflux system outer membrane protein
MTIFMPRLSLALSLLPFMLGACDLLAEPTQPAIKTPTAWVAPTPIAADAWPSADWWRRIGSAELDAFMVEAQAQNLDLVAATARIAQVEAQARITSSALWPQLSLGADASRRGPLDPGAYRDENNVPAGTDLDTDSFGLSLAASYEVDFWGRNRANRTAALESLRASAYDRQTVALTVSTSVASTYLGILSLREQIAIADNNLANARDILQVVEAKTRLGSVSPADLAQQRGVVAAQEATLAPLLQQEREALVALAVLLGRNPQDIQVDARSLGDLIVPLVTGGLPSELLQRRPDIARAEADLASADANVVAARAAFFPSLDLSGALSLETAVLSTLFGPAGAAYSIAGSLAQPIFDGGRLIAEEDLAIAQREELIANYRAAIITAFSDVENALGLVRSLADQVRLQEEQVAQAQIAFDIVNARYLAGAVDLIELLNAQRTLFDAQDTLGQLRLQQMQAAIGLYGALGGGWQDRGKA